MTLTCGLCRKFHSYECPAEDQDTVRFRTYVQEANSAPFSDVCFEPKEGISIDPVFQVQEDPLEKILKKTPPPQREYISKLWEEALKPMSLDDVRRIFDRTIKLDNENKLIVFLTMLMNYLGDYQQNLLFNAPSSTGKSYIALEIAKLFPPEDIDKKGYVSPTSFFHVEGKLCTPDGKPLEDRLAYIQFRIKEWEEKNPPPKAPDTFDKSEEAVKARRALSEWKAKRKEEIRRLKEEWNKLEKVYVVNLERRILIFKDQPHDRVLQVLRSMLSHDEKILEVDITDKTKEGGHRTKRIKVIGFPTIVFCSASFSLDEQERTRFWLLSPDITQEKIRESLRLQAERFSDAPKFDSLTELDLERLKLMLRIRAIKKECVQEVIIPQPLMGDLLVWFTKDKEKGKDRDLTPRDLRDFPRLIALVKGHALFQVFQRERTPEGHIIATEEDVQKAEDLLNGILESNRYGLPPYVFRFYNNCLRHLDSNEGISREEFGRLYFNEFKERLGDKAKKRLIELLSEAGLVEERPDPADKRKMRIYIPLEGVEENSKNPQAPGQGQAGNTTREGGDKIPPSSVDKECCKTCQEFEPSTEFCHITGERVNPNFHCGKFKPRPKLYKCSKCGGGPWKDYKLAQEHIQLCGEDHKIMEVLA